MQYVNGRVASTAAMLGLTLGNHPKYAAWYDPDHWSGQVGLVSHLGEIASRLEALTDYEMQIGEGVDWYLTTDAIVDALISNTFEYNNLERYLCRWGE